MKALIFALIILSGTQVFAQNTNQDVEKFLILPQFGYSDDQGLGIGANATWTNISGTGWQASSSLYSSSLYSQTFLTLDILNRHFEDNFYVAAGGWVNNSGRSLFYGTGNDSSLDNVNQYSISDTYAYVRGGVRFLDDFVFGLGYTHRSTSIGLGSDPALPQFVNTYVNDPRLSGTTTTATDLFLMYDTRTPTYAPDTGNFGWMSLEQAQPRSGEDLAQQTFLLAGENFTDLAGKDLVLVSHAQYEREWGEGIPFFMEPTLGGEDTLRGYRINRFIDAGSMVINEEPRWKFWTPGGDIIKRVELSFAVELGRVFDGTTFPPLGGYHADWDLGLTGLLDGDIPLRLDYAFGPEGNLFYLHLFYPF